MSNDLINRQETYKELIGRIDYIRDKDYKLYCEIGDVIQDCIENIPTAYDIDKVIEQMEEMLNPEIEKKRCFSTSCDITDNCTECALKHAIEIVCNGCIHNG